MSMNREVVLSSIFILFLLSFTPVSSAIEEITTEYWYVNSNSSAVIVFWVDFEQISWTDKVYVYYFLRPDNTLFSVRAITNNLSNAGNINEIMFNTQLDSISSVGDVATVLNSSIMVFEPGIWNMYLSQCNIDGTYCILVDTSEVNIGFPVITPSPSPSPTAPPSYNNTDTNGSFIIDESGSIDFVSYSDGIVSSISDSTQLMFSMVSYPISVLNSSIYLINSSLNHSSYTVSMSFLMEIIPAFDQALPNKFKAVITFGLVLMAILIILGRE